MTYPMTESSSNFWSNFLYYQIVMNQLISRKILQHENLQTRAVPVGTGVKDF